MAPPSASATKLISDIDDKLTTAYSLIHPYGYYSEAYLTHVAKSHDLATLANEPGHIIPPSSADVENAQKLAAVNHLISQCKILRNAVTSENTQDARTKFYDLLSAFNEDFLLISQTELRDLVSKHYPAIRLAIAAHRSDLPQKDPELQKLVDRRHKIYALLNEALRVLLQLQEEV